MAKTDFYLVELDETEWWMKSFVAQHNIKQISTIYLFDKNTRTHCCSTALSYWLIPMYSIVDPPEKLEECDQSINNCSNYYDCVDIDLMFLVKVDDFEYITDSEYNEKLEEVREDCCETHLI